MILRPRQQVFVDRCVAALKERGNTLGIAPTGAGKTILLSATAGRMLGKEGRGLVLQHRDELVTQNRAKFRAVNPGLSTGVVDATDKQFSRQVTFASVPTLCRDQNLERLPAQDFVAVDESHHIAASTWLKIIDHAKELNPKVKILGVTATPERGDTKSLRQVFDNIGDVIGIGELVAAGHLVRPRTFVVDIGTQAELKNVRKTASDFDMNEVEKIMDKEVHNERVVAEWKKLAGDRQTVVFCATVEHAAHVTEAFVRAGVRAELVHGNLGREERRAVLARLDKGQTQVVVNVAVLTEGFDSQPVSCVVLLRPSSQKSTMIQMIGRGLRTVDPELYPGVKKSDCIIIDFGTSVLMHGSLEQDISDVLADKSKKQTDAAKKECPECSGLSPINAMTCALCGYIYIHSDPEAALERSAKEALEHFVLTEIDLLDASPFRWEEIFDGLVSVATAFDAWAMCVCFQGEWYGLGGAEETGVKVLASGDKLICMASADDFLRQYGDTKGAGKAKRWLTEPATPKQLAHMGLGPVQGFGVTRYKAACHLTWKFNERSIRARLQESRARNVENVE